MIRGIVILLLIELIVPVLLGSLFALSDKKVNSRIHFLLSSLASGQIVLYAVFQTVMVYSILKNKKFSGALDLFIPVACVLLVIMLVTVFIGYRKRMISILKSPLEKTSLWGVLAGLIFIFMMVMSFVMTYMDGDDAYYVANAVHTASSDAMYAVNPYMGTATVSSFRYMSAPYPMWLAMLARLSGINATALAHSFFPWSVILLVFSVMYLLGRTLFGTDAKKRGIFLFFTSILIMFGDYSIYSPENFLLGRARQGKAALAAFAIPFLLYMMLYATEELSSEKKIRIRSLALICLAGLAASLCSTIGGGLGFAVVGAFALFQMISFKKIRYPLVMCVSYLPALAFVLLYFLKR